MVTLVSQKYLLLFNVLEIFEWLESLISTTVRSILPSSWIRNGNCLFYFAIFSTWACWSKGLVFMRIFPCDWANMALRSLHRNYSLSFSSRLIDFRLQFAIKGSHYGLHTCASYDIPFKVKQLVIYDFKRSHYFTIGASLYFL